jgi:hypothetical protein
MHATEPNGRPGDRLEGGLADGDPDHDGSGPLASRKAAVLLAERLRGKVRPHQSVSELTVSAAPALPDHYATHTQLIQPDAHAPCGRKASPRPKRPAPIAAGQKTKTAMLASPGCCAPACRGRQFKRRQAAAGRLSLRFARGHRRVARAVSRSAAPASMGRCGPRRGI